MTLPFMASLIIKLPLLDLELFIHMHTLLWNMPIHHTHVYDEYHSHIGSSLRQNVMRKLYNNCVISSLWAHPIILFYFLTKSDILLYFSFEGHSFLTNVTRTT